MCCKKGEGSCWYGMRRKSTQKLPDSWGSSKETWRKVPVQPETSSSAEQAGADPQCWSQLHRLLSPSRQRFCSTCRINLPLSQHKYGKGGNLGPSCRRKKMELQFSFWKKKKVMLLVLFFIVASKGLYNYMKTNKKVFFAPSELFLPRLTFKRKQKVQEKQIPLITILKAQNI